MLEFYCIATKPNAITSLHDFTKAQPYTPNHFARPQMSLPIVTNNGGGMELTYATWGGKLQAKTTMKKILSSQYNKLIRKQRCAIPANCFFGIKDSQHYLVRILESRLFYMGGIYTKANNEIHFSVLNTEPPDMLSFLQTMPVLFKPEWLEEWLHTEQLEPIMTLADVSVNHWFDYFKVSNKVATATANNKELLMPLGESYRQFQERERKLRAMEFEKSRTDRSNSKH